MCSSNMLKFNDLKFLMRCKLCCYKLYIYNNLSNCMNKQMNNSSLKMLIDQLQILIEYHVDILSISELNSKWYQYMMASGLLNDAEHKVNMYKKQYAKHISVCDDNRPKIYDHHQLVCYDSSSLLDTNLIINCVINIKWLDIMMTKGKDQITTKLWNM